jgi:hypothetical protein
MSGSPLFSRATFTLAAASATLPAVRGHLETILGLRLRLKDMYRRLDELGHPPGETLPWGAPAEAINLHAVYAGMAEALREEADRVRATGAIIRDIEVGLVDWPAHTPSQPDRYLWSWRYGEPQIDCVRDVSDDADRRPIAELAPAVLREALGRATTDAPDGADAGRTTSDVDHTP